MWILGRRLAFSVVALLVVSLLLFVLTRAIPVSPARIVLGIDATEGQIRDFEQGLGLDRPLLSQYGSWLGQVIVGDWGKSYITGVALGPEIARTFPMTLELVALAFAFALLCGIPLGLLSARKPDGAIDNISRVVALLGVSIPGFWIGLVVVLYVAVPTGWFPPGGVVPASAGIRAHLNSLALPAFTLGIHYVAVLSRMTRSSMIEALSQDYVRTARAMGLRPHLVWLYAMKNAAAPVISIAAMAFGYCFGWALIVEQVFNIPGLSRALLNAINQRDYPLMQAIILVITMIFIGANMVADVLNEALNPKLAS